jgi:uncharacterized protein DUF6916
VLTLETFAPHQGSRFSLDGLALELAQVTPLAGGGGSREPFSLVFAGPPEPALPQRIHRLEHAQLGVLELFLVPVGPGRYEAIFT